MACARTHEQACARNQIVGYVARRLGRVSYYWRRRRVVLESGVARLHTERELPRLGQSLRAQGAGQGVAPLDRVEVSLLRGQAIPDIGAVGISMDAVAALV